MLYEKIMTINPCLHCGGEGIIKGRKKRRVVCKKCGAQGAEKPLASEAVASWNTAFNDLFPENTSEDC